MAGLTGHARGSLFSDFVRRVPSFRSDSPRPGAQQRVRAFAGAPGTEPGWGGGGAGVPERNARVVGRDAWRLSACRRRLSMGTRAAMTGVSTPVERGFGTR